MCGCLPRPTLRDPCIARTMTEKNINILSLHEMCNCLPRLTFMRRAQHAKCKDEITSCKTWNVWVPASAPTPCAHAPHAISNE